jgi:hypothetical protein
MSEELKVTISLPLAWLNAMQLEMEKRGVKVRTDYLRQAIFKELRAAGFSHEALNPRAKEETK